MTGEHSPGRHARCRPFSSLRPPAHACVSRVAGGGVRATGGGADVRRRELGVDAGRVHRIPAVRVHQDGAPRCGRLPVGRAVRQALNRGGAQGAPRHGGLELVAQGALPAAGHAAPRPAPAPALAEDGGPHPAPTPGPRPQVEPGGPHLAHCARGGPGGARHGRARSLPGTLPSTRSADLAAYVHHVPEICLPPPPSHRTPCASVLRAAPRRAPRRARPPRRRLLLSSTSSSCRTCACSRSRSQPRRASRTCS